MIRSALEYHTLTSYDRMQMSDHFMNWAAQPTVFKAYPGRDAFSLAQNRVYSQEKLSKILERDCHTVDPTQVDFERLSRILVMSHALTAKARYEGVDFYYRSVASAGALYPFEQYVAVSNVPNLEEGVYHHSVANQSLTLLRAGNPFPELSRAMPVQHGARPTLAFFLTSIFFRSSWKYRDRAYRYHLLDTGHLAESLSLALKSECLRFTCTYDFDDRAINELLGIDIAREGCLAVALAWSGRSEHGNQDLALGKPAPDLAVSSRVSAREIDYPAIREIHHASSAVVEPRQQVPSLQDELGFRVENWTQVPQCVETPETMSYAEAVMKRRSMRNFVSHELGLNCFAYLLQGICAALEEASDEDRLSLESVQIGLLIEKVQGLDPGFYLLDRSKTAFGLVRAGLFTDQMAHVCLDQQWLSNCAIHFLFLTNFGALERTRGPRGYRYAMLSAGRLGQRIYVSATSMKIGCCGIGAFYDTEAAKLLGLNKDTRLLYLVATGPVKKWSLGSDSS